MNYGIPHFWTLIGFAGIIIGWIVMLLKFGSAWGKTELNVSNTLERVTDLEKDAKRLRELKITEGDILTFRSHEKMCGEHLDALEKRIEKMIDLKLDAFESHLLLAIKTGKKARK
jgi:hypothetical protein